MRNYQGSDGHSYRPYSYAFYDMSFEISNDGSSAKIFISVWRKHDNKYKKFDLTFEFKVNQFSFFISDF